MARSLHSPSLTSSPMSPPSPSFSDSSADEQLSIRTQKQDATGPSASRPGSPFVPHQKELPPVDAGDAEDSVTCLWDDCGLVYTHLPTLIDHIHNDHIGMHKSNYTCEWTTCQRRGLAQTSRFALISHIRSHTGEKPFTCALPECDKSFTRSDALAKHMRLQHNIDPPAPGRGGSRKRKRGPDDQLGPSSRGQTPPTAPANNGTFGTFKVEPSPYPEPLSSAPVYERSERSEHQHHFIANGNGHRSVSPHSPRPRRPRDAPPDPDRPDDEEGYTSSSSDVLPAHLMTHYVPATNLVLGRSPSMVMYLLMKAKHKYALEQHESLLEELRVTKAELKRERDDKDRALDDLLMGIFGHEAEQFIAPITPSSSHPIPSHPDPHPGPAYMTNGNGY